MSTLQAVGSVVTDGLVLYLDAANYKSYPGSGTAWSDLTINNNNGTLTNGPTFSSANGGSIVFDGVDDYVSGSSFTPNFTNKTLSAWVKLNSVSQQGGGVINIQSDSGTIFDAIVYNETNSGWGFGSNSFLRTTWSGVKETSTNNWVNILATYQNNNYNLYRNGVVILNTTSYLAYNFNFSSKSLLGYRHTGGTGAFLSANISNAQIYNRALSAGEVLQNYNALKRRFNL